MDLNSIFFLSTRSVRMDTRRSWLARREYGWKASPRIALAVFFLLFG